MQLYSVFYYDCTGAKGVASYDALNQIHARDQFLAQHPNCNVNYIESRNGEMRKR
jgi:hypothetical protein